MTKENNVFNQINLLKNKVTVNNMKNIHLAAVIFPVYTYL